MKISASELKPFESHLKVKIPNQARQEEWLSCSKLKQAFLINSNTNFSQTLGSAHEKFGVWTGP